MVIKVFLGADHAGFQLKEEVKPFLRKYDLKDLGAFTLIKDDDYPVYAKKVAKEVVKEKGCGILICGSGQGVCIAANKVKGIRAIVAENERDAFLGRKDDDTNVLCLQGRYTSLEKAKVIIKTFLETKFANKKRYKRRIKELE